MDCQSISVQPLAGAIGAEIAGVDLAQELDADTIVAIRHAWLDHLVIFVRDQTLPPARLLALARRFGRPIEYPFRKGMVLRPSSAARAAPPPLIAAGVTLRVTNAPESRPICPSLPLPRYPG